jgi:protocatechuate 3,4-dioxygenase beta subunit
MRALSVLLPVCLIAISSQADEVSGLVLGPDGKPIPQARIVVTPADSKEDRTLATDAAGRFRLDLPPFRYGGTYRGRVLIATPGAGLDGGTLQQGDNTFRLEVPATARGKVLDTQGKPLAGVRIAPVLLMWENPRRHVWLREVVGGTEYSTKTDPAGNWAIENLPVSANVDVEVVDDRFVRLRTSVPIGQPATEPLVVRPAAVLTGKVVDESGKPLAGVEVFAQGQRAQDGWARSVSKEDGSYRLNGLASGTYNIMTAVPPEKNLVAAALEGVLASEGKTAQLENLVATPGAIIEGVVTDAESGKPVVGASIGSYGPHRPESSAAVISASTDEKGRYSLRVAPGDSRVYVMGLPENYVSPEQGSAGSLLNLRLKKGQKTSVPFRLPRALTLSGVAVDESGAPATGATLYIGERYERAPVTIDATGRWTVTGLKAGNVPVSTSTGEGQEWSLVTPPQVKLPHNGPLRLVLRRLNLLAATARVLSLQGDPIAGAQVSAQILTPIGNEGMLQSREAKVTSKADGTFSVGNLRPDDRISTLTVKQPGYVYSSGGKVTNEKGSFGISNVVLAKLDGRLNGRVLGNNGAPVPGAKVLVPEGGAAALTQTGKDGRFTLQALPHGQVTVLAFASGMTGQARVRTADSASNADVALQLTVPKPLPANDTQRAYGILERVAAESAGKEYYARRSLPVTLAPFDRELAGKLQVAMGGETLPNNTSAMISQLAELDRERLVQLAPQLIPRLEAISSASDKVYALATLGLALAPTNSKLAQTLYEGVRATVKTQGLKPRPGEEYSLMLSYGHAAALAARLGQPEAEGFSDAALVVAEQSFSNAPEGGDEGRLDQVRTMLVELVAQGSASLAERIASELPAGARLRGLSRAVEQLASHDLAGAQRLLELVASSEKPAPTQSQFRYSGDDPEFSFGLAAKRVIAELGKSDPSAALALATRVKSPEHRAMALALAAQVQDEATAAEVFRQAIAAGTSDYSRRGNLPQIAVMAFQKNPTLGRELFEEFKPRYTTPSTSPMDETSPSAFAFYYAPIDPAESRLMLEREWARQLENRGGGGNNWNGSDLVLAMAAIDIDRALEMAQALPSDNARFDTQRKIAQYVLASSEVRRTMPFNRWNASDTWTPGTPSQW